MCNVFLCKPNRKCVEFDQRFRASTLQIPMVHIVNHNISSFPEWNIYANLARSDAFDSPSSSSPFVFCCGCEEEIHRLIEISRLSKLIACETVSLHPTSTNTLSHIDTHAHTRTIRTRLCMRRLSSNCACRDWMQNVYLCYVCKLCKVPVRHEGWRRYICIKANVWNICTCDDGQYRTNIQQTCAT